MARLKIKLPTFGKSAEEPGNKGASKRLVLSGATLCCALGIGYIMQFGLGLPGQSGAKAPLDVANITDASSGVAMPKFSADLTDMDINLAATEPLQLPSMEGIPSQSAPSALLPQNDVAAVPTCDITMNATQNAGAMVDLRLDAPCNASERVTLHHHGMMFTEVMQPDGTLSLRVPALSENAVFIAAFGNGDGASASVEVNSLSFYDRVVVQWKGKAGFQLHAREYEAAYFEPGHVWARETGDLGKTARGEGGFMVRLGQVDAPDALMAEVYSFPTGTAQRGGEIALTVEAEITETNCGKAIEAQTLELKHEEGIEVHDLVLNLGDCDGVGDFLVLKNLVEDLTIASK